MGFYVFEIDLVDLGKGFDDFEISSANLGEVLDGFEMDAAYPSKGLVILK